MAQGALNRSAGDAVPGLAIATGHSRLPFRRGLGEGPLGIRHTAGPLPGVVRADRFLLAVGELQPRFKVARRWVRAAAPVLHHHQDRVRPGAQVGGERVGLRRQQIGIAAHQLIIHVELILIVRRDYRLGQLGGLGQLQHLAQRDGVARLGVAGVVDPDPVRARLHTRVRVTAQDGAMRTRRPRARDLPHRIHELLRRQPPRHRARIDERSRVSLHRGRVALALISLRTGDEGEHLLHIVAIRREAIRQIIQQVRAPGLRVHRIHRVHDAAPHEPMPQAVHDRAGEAAIVLMRHQRCQFLQALRFRLARVDGSQLWENPRSPGHAARGLVAAIDL